MITLLYLCLIIFIFYVLNNSINENFQNYVNPFFKNKCFCSFDIDSNKCKCTYQKDGINIPFNSPEISCFNKCNNKNKEECNKNTDEDAYYYCKEGNNCKKYKATIQNKYISTNNCGIDVLTNQIKLPYITEESCKNSINLCDKYNKKNLNNSQIKENCLKDTNCGYCENNYGNGKCVEGTAEGPLNLNDNCSANSKTNKYEYGNFLFY